MHFRGDISEELGELALQAFVGLDYALENPPGLWEAATDVAKQLGWAKTYDAEYVALSRMLGYPLVTLDARMARGARRMAQIIGPADIS